MREEDDTWERSNNIKNTDGIRKVGSSVKRGSKASDAMNRKMLKFKRVENDWGHRRRRQPRRRQQSSSIWCWSAPHTLYSTNWSRESYTPSSISKEGRGGVKFALGDDNEAFPFSKENLLHVSSPACPDPETT